MINDLYIINNPQILQDNRIILYGTGSSAKRDFYYLKHMGYEVECFTATYAKENEKYCGKRVLSLDRLKDYLLYNNCVVIIASMYYEEIIKTMQEKKIEPEYVCTEFGLRYSLLFAVNNKQYSQEQTRWFYDMMELDHYTNYKRRLYNAMSAAEMLENMELYGDSIIIYQYGKCGSSSIHNTLIKCHKNAEHIHYIKNGITEEARENNLRLFDRVQNILQKKDKVKIITLVREPISRTISKVFYRMALSDAYWYYGTDFMKKYSNIEEFVRNAMLYPRMGNEIDRDINKWFEIEFRDTLGIDVLKYDFDRDKGYTIIQEGNVEVLLLQMEKMNENEAVIGDFVGIEGFKLANSNMGENNEYQYVYRDMKNDIKIPQEMFDIYYLDNEYMKHFYSKEDLNKFKLKWEKRIFENVPINVERD